MKTELTVWAVVTVASLGMTTTSLGGETEQAGVQASFLDPDAAEARSFRNAGEYAIDRLMMTMVMDASSAVARHTEVAALATFHLKDVPMKNGTIGGLPRITAMKLTSLKVRNPANAPDAAETLALNKVQQQLERGVSPGVLVQRVELPSGSHEIRVYKPLAVIRQCGTCHADTDAQSPELRLAIQEHYPSDQATGYSLGQFRGLIRVTVADEPAPTAATAGAPKR